MGEIGPRTRARTESQAAAAGVRRLVDEACNDGNLALLRAVLAPSCHPQATLLPELLGVFRAAAPDARWTIEEQIAQGETVVTRLRVTGTFSGPLLGLAPPGRPATVAGVAISRFARGRLVELWLQADLLGFLQQLGVMPALDLTQAVALTQMEGIGQILHEVESREPINRTRDKAHIQAEECSTAARAVISSAPAGPAGMRRTRR